MQIFMCQESFIVDNYSSQKSKVAVQSCLLRRPQSVSHDIARYELVRIEVCLRKQLYRTISHDFQLLSCDIARYFHKKYRVIIVRYRAIIVRYRAIIVRYRAIIMRYRAIKLFSQADLNPHLFYRAIQIQVCVGDNLRQSIVEANLVEIVGSIHVGIFFKISNQLNQKSLRYS